MAEENVVIMDAPEKTTESLEIEIRKKLQEEYDSRLESEIKKISARMQEENTKIVQEALERYRKEMTPPTSEDIQKLLEQEYLEFKVDVRVGGTSKNFVIRELPQKVEKRMFKKIKDVLVPFSSELESVKMNLLDGDPAKKIVQLMNTFEPIFELMVSVAAITLNPFGEEEGINEEWISEHLSSTRIMHVVNAQMEANRMRDFFSLLSQSSKQLAK